MPTSRSRSSSSRASRTPSDGIDRLDYKPGGRPLLQPRSNDGSRSASRHSEDRASLAGSFFSNVAEGIVDRDRERMRKEVARYVSFVWALVNCLGAGGITAYSLYAPLFQHRLRYTQLQVNAVSITAELALYLPVPFFGYLSDRYGPKVPSLLSGLFFGVGYVLAAFAYGNGPPPSAGGTGWPHWVMMLAFVPIGCGTSCMYLSGVTTCAKNFGRGKHKGLALALPIACFGLSGMWQAQVGSKLFYEKRPGESPGDVDVYHFFLFLAALLFTFGTVGGFLLRVVDEVEFIDEAVDELEQSGLLIDSDFFQRDLTAGHPSRHCEYGTLSYSQEEDDAQKKIAEEKARRLEERRKKTWLLNEETRRFLADTKMWWFAAGFFLVTGPGEAFINNLGTIIGTLYLPSSDVERTSAATHVSIVAIASTVTRILTGTVTDILAPQAEPHQHRHGPNSLVNSTASLSAPPMMSRRLQVSRIAFLITFSVIMSIGQLILASGLLQGHGDLFWLVSGTIGSGYGAVFSLTPICISVIWGVENFGTNWGIVATFPAVGATIWGLLYSGVYQWAAGREGEQAHSDEVLCYGMWCYAPTFWGMSVSVWVACALWFWVWRGPGGLVRSGVAL